MITNLKPVDPVSIGGKQEVVEELEALLERARKGEVIGFIYMTSDTDNFYTHGKVNLKLDAAVMMASRMMYRYNKIWDDDPT